MPKNNEFYINGSKKHGGYSRQGEKMTCPKCKERAIFYESRRIPTRDGIGQELAIGMLSCPVCGYEDYISQYVIPALGKSNLEER